MMTKYLRISKGRALNIGSCPNFHATGSIKGMKRLYGEKALLVQCGSYIYNVISRPDIYDEAK